MPLSSFQLRGPATGLDMSLNSRRGMQSFRVTCAAQKERIPATGAKVVGMGGCGVDYLAQVAAYPRPDEKLRTEKLEVQGGGNCGNALTGAARLGLAVEIVSKIGSDSLGDGIIAEFKRDHVSTAHLLRAAGAPSPFTYIIVDREGGTRTCIHTPSEPMLAEEMSESLADQVLEGTALVYFDGRLTEPALKLAAAAKRKGVPVLVEGERLRPHLEELLAFADFVVTSAHFPQEWTGEVSVGDAILSTFHRLPSARWMVTTLGSRGCVLLERVASSPTASNSALEAAVLEDLLTETFAELQNVHNAAAAAGQGAATAKPAPACVNSSGVEIFEGRVAAGERPMLLQLQRGGALGDDRQEAEQRRAVAAQRAAAANADAGNAAEYAGYAKWTGQGASVPANGLVARVSIAQAAQLPQGAVLDTTGAGDSFIGCMLYSIATRQRLPDALRLASVVAAANCTMLGARTGMPRWQELRADLL